MAAEDYVVADRTIQSLTAGEKVQETVFENPDADAKEFAHDEGVSQAAYANYATALNAHQARPDIETLADRRAREYGDQFSDADFMRTEVYDPVTGEVNDPPRAGSVEGDAPKSA